MIDEIKKYTLYDIRKLQCLAIAAEYNDRQNQNQEIGLGRLTTALASIIFGAAEMIGILLKDDLTDDNHYNRLTDNLENAQYFFNKVQGWGLKQIDKNDINIIYKVYRNGFTHSLFPKLGMGISHNIEFKNREEVIINNSHSVDLNIAYLTDYMIKAIEIFICKYENDKIKKLVDKNFNLYVKKQNEDLRMKINDELKEIIRNKYKPLGTALDGVYIVETC